MKNIEIYKSITKQLLLCVLLLVISIPTFAQGPGFDDDVDDVPIDGGVSLLVAAGIGYGLKKYNDSKK